MTVIFSVIAFLIAMGCSTGNNRSEKIIVSIPPQVYIVKHLLGDDADVTAIINSDANPELFEPSVNTMMKLMNSAVYFSVGTLDFEKKLVNDVLEKGSTVKVSDTSEGVALLYGTHGEDEHSEDCGHHHHDAPDPHIWATPENMKVMAGNIANELNTVFPEKSALIKKNLADFNAKMDSCSMALRNAISESRIRAFMVWHPSLSYLAEQYGLNQIVVGSHAKELSVRQLAERIERAEKSEAKILFIQKEFDSRQIQTVVSELPIRMFEINPMSEDWENQFRIITDALK